MKTRITILQEDDDHTFVNQINQLTSDGWTLISVIALINAGRISDCMYRQAFLSKAIEREENES